MGVSRPTVTSRRNRYETEGPDGLSDAPRSGAPPKLTEARTDEILETTLAPPPGTLWVTHCVVAAADETLGDVCRM